MHLSDFGKVEDLKCELANVLAALERFNLFNDVNPFNGVKFGYGEELHSDQHFMDHDFVALIAESAKSGLQEWIARLECSLSELGVEFDAVSVDGQKAQKRAFPANAPDGTKHYRLLRGHELLGKGSIVTYIGLSNIADHFKVKCIHVGEIDLPIKILALSTKTDLFKPPVVKGA